ncbi:hypothetical protein V502_10862 [Pseudogymnoascus sp. VKM F-4520 (FW-2644)]|nr:hypothetical protein V502_10862 [Pseudogymnoascus sp. VKM F-4520 (FW-2644)]
MGDWILRPLERLDSWDGKCLWYKTRKLGGREQRCSRNLKAYDGDRKQILANVTELVQEGSRPRDDVLRELAGLMLCPANHRSTINQQLLCGRWIARWAEDHIDEDDSDGGSDDGDDNDQNQEDDYLPSDDLDTQVSSHYAATCFQTNARQEHPDMDDFEDSAYFSDDNSNSSVHSDISGGSADPEIFTLPLDQDDDPTPLPSPTSTLAPQPAATNNPPAIPAHIRSYGPYTTHSPQEISRALQTKLEQALSPAEISSRIIYGFREVIGSPYIKIGITNDFGRRRGELFRGCGYRCEDLVFQLETRHAMKVEHLVQKHLAAERRREDVSRFVGQGGCNIHMTHVEWFEVGDERVAEVVEGWVRFMKLKPFGEVGDGEAWELKREWKGKLGEVEADHEEGDRWLQWLERYAPATTSDTNLVVSVDVTEEEEVEEVVEEVVGEAAAFVPDFIRSTTNDDVLPPFQQPTSPTEAHTAYLYTTSIPPYLPPTNSGLPQPNLVTSFLFHALQLVFFLTIVGNISCQQLASLVLLGFATLVARQSDRAMTGESGDVYSGVLRGVYYPDLTGRLAAMDR